MHATHTDNPSLALRLTLSIVYRIIPDYSSSSEGETFLKAKRSESKIFIGDALSSFIFYFRWCFLTPLPFWLVRIGTYGETSCGYFLKLLSSL